MKHIEQSVVCIDNKDLYSVISFYILHLILLMCYVFVTTWVNMNFNIRTISETVLDVYYVYMYGVNLDFNPYWTHLQDNKWVDYVYM